MKSTESKNLRYILYCRKSTDSEDRQIQSLDDQKHELERIVHSQSLKVVKVFSESMSAKKPGRPMFDEMLRMNEPLPAASRRGIRSTRPRYRGLNAPPYTPAQGHRAASSRGIGLFKTKNTELFSVLCTTNSLSLSNHKPAPTR